MQLTVAEPELVPVALAAIKSVATARAAMHPTQRSMLALAQKLIVGSEVDVDAVAPVNPTSWRGPYEGAQGPRGSSVAWCSSASRAAK